MEGIILTALSFYFLLRIPCFSSDGSSFGLSYHGGKLMTEPVTVSLLWFGTGWEESSRAAIRNAITSLTPSRYLGKYSDVPTLGDWWDVVRQYKDNSYSPVTDRVDIGAECFYTGPQLNMTRGQVFEIGSSVFNKTSIDRFGGNLNCSHVFEVNENSLYHVVFSHTVMFSNGKEEWELVNLCSGSVQLEVSVGQNVSMAWVRSPQDVDDQCSMFFQLDSYLGPPNGDQKIDSLVGYVLAKIAEQATNPDEKGWTGNDGSGLTVGTSCAAAIQQGKAGPPLFRDEEKNVSFNAVGVNGHRHIVQYIWDQKLRNCALKLSESCGTTAVVFKQPKGHLKGGIVVNHADGLQPYPPNQKCRWMIHYPTAKFISFKINYLSLSPNSDDHLQICPSDSSSMQCINIQATNSDSNFKVMSSTAFIEFTSGEHVSFESRGWELSYSVGFCNGKEDVYDHDGTVGYTLSTNLPYVEGLSCQWVLHGKPGTLVYLIFSHINISRNVDFIAIYNSNMKQIANFSGFYTGSDLPQLNLTGEVRIAFSTQTDKGEGWSASFYISLPVKRDRKGLIVLIVVVVAVVALGVSLAFIAMALLKRRRKQTNTMDSDEGIMLIKLDTDSDENRIGEGPSAIVYKAVSTYGSLVAVKTPRDMASKTDLEEKILIKSSAHPNIISLVGYAQYGLRKRYLVFEFMGRGSLSWTLRERGEAMDWPKRLAIALQICSAIQMLHMYLKPPIYHRNITSENILLDELYNAKLAGFGTANYCDNNSRDHENLVEMPEDIWGFGILLVELLRGQPLVDRHAYRNLRSLEEINELVGGQECLDRRLSLPSEKCKIMGLAKFGEIAKWCIGICCGPKGDGNNPKIGDVLSGLKQVKQVFSSLSD